MNLIDETYNAAIEHIAAMNAWSKMALLDPEGIKKSSIKKYTLLALANEDVQLCIKVLDKTLLSLVKESIDRYGY